MRCDPAGLQRLELVFVDRECPRRLRLLLPWWQPLSLRKRRRMQGVGAVESQGGRGRRAREAKVQRDWVRMRGRRGGEEEGDLDEHILVEQRQGRRER